MGGDSSVQSVHNVATDGIELGEFSANGLKFLCWDFAGLFLFIYLF